MLLCKELGIHSGNAVNRDARCCALLGVLVLIARVHAIVICLGLDIQFQTLILIYISNFGLCCIAFKYASYRITLHIKQDIYFKIQIIGTASSCIVLKLN